MTITTIRTRVLQVISEQAMDTPVDQLRDDMTLTGDLGFDSLDIVELQFLVEGEVAGLELEDTEIDALKTVGDLIALVEQKLAATA